jgi:hypothetical protein
MKAAIIPPPNVSMSDFFVLNVKFSCCMWYHISPQQFVGSKWSRNVLHDRQYLTGTSRYVSYIVLDVGELFWELLHKRTRNDVIHNIVSRY